MVALLLVVLVVDRCKLIAQVIGCQMVIGGVLLVHRSSLTVIVVTGSLNTQLLFQQLIINIIEIIFIGGGSRQWEK